MPELPEIKQLQSEEIFNLFCMQLKKDFERAGADTGFGGQLPSGLEPLVKTIGTHLENISRKNAGSVSTILYMVDADEKEINKLIYETNEAFFSENLAYFEKMAIIIIRRELQKVITRLTFKTNGND